MKHRLSLCALAIATSALPACFVTGEDADETNADVVIGVDDAANKVTVKEDRLEFDVDLLPKMKTTLAKIDAYAEAGDKHSVEPVVLVGNRQAKALDADGAIKDGLRNPQGYLRRAVSWKKSGKMLVIMTERATIAEATVELQKNGFTSVRTSSLAPLAGGADGDESAPRGSLNRSLDFTFGPPDGFRPIDLSGTTLWEKKLLSGGKAAVVLTKGRMTITPHIETDLAVENFVPTHGSAMLSTELLGELEIEATADGAFDFEKSGTLWSKKFGGTMQGFPVSMAVEVGWQCALGVSGKASVLAGAKASGSLRGGASFEGTTVTGVLDKPTYAFETLGPKVDSKVIVKGACHLIATLGLELFDSAGPNASVDVYTGLDLDASTRQASGDAIGSMTVGVATSVGGSLRPFGINLGEISVEPFRSEKKFSANVAL